VAALLRRGQLVFEVHAGGARFDHRLHQLEGVEHAAEARFGVSDDRLQEIDAEDKRFKRPSPQYASRLNQAV